MTDKTQKKGKTLVSPVGEALFTVLANPRTNDKGKQERSVRILIRGDAPGAEAFKKELKRINKDLLVTEQKNKETGYDEPIKDSEGKDIRDGDFVFNARTIGLPTVLDKDGSALHLNELPQIDKGTTMSAVVSEFESKQPGKAGGITLQSVRLVNVKIYEGAGTMDEDDVRAALKAAGQL